MVEKASGKQNKKIIRMKSGSDSKEIGFSLPEATLAAEYLNYLIKDKLISPSVVEHQIIIEVGCKSEAPPFLSIITRTQGTRIEELKDVLRCLTEQTDISFELLLIAHNTTGENLEKLKMVVELQPEWLRDRISLTLVKGGTRSRPLNVALSIARGEYFCALDDDDLVYENWVSVFHKSSKEHYGSILFSYVLSQIWGRRQNREEGIELFEKESPRTTYCEDFDFLRQISENRCPLVGLAFPMALSREFGLRFDDTLTTTEDWDFLMRSYPICGISNTQTATSVYRFFEGASNSSSLYSQDEWEKNRTTIQEKLKDYPILLPAKYHESLLSQEEGYEYFKELSNDDVRLYINPEEDVSRSEYLRPSNSAYNPKTKKNFFCFSINDAEQDVFSLLFIPMRKGLITLEDFEVRLLFSNRVEKTLWAYDVIHNGVSPENGTIVFLVRNPCIVINFKRGCRVEKASVSYKLRSGVEESMITGTLLVVRTKEKIQRILRRIKASQ